MAATRRSMSLYDVSWIGASALLLYRMTATRTQLELMYVYSLTTAMMKLSICVHALKLVLVDESTRNANSMSHNEHPKQQINLTTW